MQWSAQRSGTTDKREPHVHSTQLQTLTLKEEIHNENIQRLAGPSFIWFSINIPLELFCIVTF